MTIKEKLKMVRDFEAQALMLSKEAIEDIVDKLSQPIEMHGVKQINSSPKCVLVSFKSFAENNWNFSIGSTYLANSSFLFSKILGIIKSSILKK